MSASFGDTVNLAMRSNSTLYTSNYNSGTGLYSSYGVFNLTDVTFFGEPGSDATLVISSPFIDGTLELADPDYSIAPTISFRSCLSGEEFTSDGQCLECSPGSYLIEAPSSPTTCLICPYNAECFGGNKVSPKPGYWRSS